jgi:dUTP pyrophosphatase
MVEAGEKYKHFKGGEYEVVDVARNCDNADQEVVVYRTLYGDGGTWIRLLDEFEGFKEFEDGRRVKRFELICEGVVRVKIKKLKSNATVPRYAHPGDAAMDLFSAEDITVPAGKRRLVSTGIAIELPQGYFSSIRGKSGLALKKGIDILGGVIEYTYTGEYGVIIFNTGDEDFVINVGDKIAQVVIAPVASAEVEVVSELSESVRGEGAFGSTGGSNI